VSALELPKNSGSTIPIEFAAVNRESPRAHKIALFLTLPISWRGTLSQYAGRLSRLYAGKKEVTIYDYVDLQEPMLARMAAKRAIGYRNLGYRESSNEALPAKAAQQSFNLRHPGKK
jgi:hypothetical protein